VGDRSLLTELLAILLVANFTWPCSGYGSLCTPSGPTHVYSGSSEAHSGVRVRSRDDKPFPERRVSTPRGVLDDDPAILCDDSEDWFEGCTRFVPAPMAELVHSSFVDMIPFAGFFAGRATTHTLPIDFLCSYRC
jgi:hypothetical protein